MAEKACHTVASTTQVGLTQALAAQHTFTQGEQMVFGNMFGGGGFVVGDVRLSAPPKTETEALRMCQEISKSLAKRLPTEQDVYWFVVEQYDRLFPLGDTIREILGNTPLFDIEFRGSRSESSYVGKPNPGVVYLDQHVMPTIEAHFGKETALRSRALIYVFFRDGFKAEIKRLRIKYAAHYANNASFSKAEEWDEVIAALEAAP